MADSPEVLRAIMDERRDGFLRLLAEIDTRYEQRFAAQEKALKTALEAQEKVLRNVLVVVAIATLVIAWLRKGT